MATTSGADPKVHQRMKQTLPKVRRSVWLAVLSTVGFMAGLVLAALVAVKEFADLASGAFDLPIEQKTISAALAAALVILGLWGFRASRRGLEAIFTMQLQGLDASTMREMVEKFTRPTRIEDHRSSK